MDNEAGVVLAFEYLRNDLIEVNHDRLNSRRKKSKSQIRGRQRTRDRDAFSLDFAG